LGWPSFFGAIVMAKTTKNPLYFIQALMVATTFVLFYFVTFSSYPLTKTIIGILITMLTGLSLYFYLRASKGLNFKGVNSRQILALRYWLLLLMPLALISYRHEFSLITLDILGKGVVIGLITLVLPLYFGQLCIEKFGSEKFSLAMGFTPILTFLLQFFMLKADLLEVFIALTLALAIALPMIVSYLSKQWRIVPQI
jgi:threonine/homoserine efflux transporter RhtA